MNEEMLFEAVAKRLGISITQLKMRLAVPDDVVRAIVADNRRSSPLEPRSIAEKPKGNGWIDPVPLRAPNGIEWVDRLCDAQDAKDRRGR
jgi:hypothetical protein